MLHPSYTDLMKVVNSEVEPGEQPVVNSRYSIVMATSKRARQIIGGEGALVSAKGKKPLSVAIEELSQSRIRIIGEEEAEVLLAAMEEAELLAEEDVQAEESVQAGESQAEESVQEENSRIEELQAAETEA